MTDIALDEKALAETQVEFDNVPPGLVEAIVAAWNRRASPSQVAPQPQAGEPVAEQGAISKDELLVAMNAASNQILDSYRTWVADDTEAKPRYGQIPRYDQLNNAITRLEVFGIASPQAANPAQVTDAYYDSVALEAAREIMTLTRSGVFDDRLKAKIQVRISEAIAAIGAGGQAVAAYIQREVLDVLSKDKTATGTVCSGLLKTPFGNPVPLYTHPAPSGQAVAWRWRDDDDQWQVTCDEDCASYEFRIKGRTIFDLFAITTPATALSQPHPADERVVEALRIVRPEIKSETEILKRLADGDEIAFSEDGDEAFFTKGDRAFVGPAIISMRSKGYLKRIVLNDENYRGTAERDVISDAGRAALAAKEGR